ncbi:MAG: hypothetical protein ABI333_12475 [bacterium]
MERAVKGSCIMEKIREQQLLDALAAIERDLASCAVDPAAVSGVLRARSGLQELREQYTGTPSADRSFWERHLERLQACGESIRRCLSSCRDHLAAEFLRADQSAKKWQEAREACRDALIELARTEQITHVQAAEGRVVIKESITTSLPPNDTPEREELVQIIEQTGRWAEVGVLNPARLRKALDQGGFSEEQAARIAELCPPKTIYRLTVLPSATDQQPPSDW